jgi:erythromycin esterase
MRPHFILFFLLLLFSGTGCVAVHTPRQPVQPETNEAVDAWLRQNAIPLRYLEAGHGFTDLHPLEGVLKDVRIVGLGESTHGTREFFQVKHRILEFLVTELGFTAFVIEAPYSDTRPINNYVLHGEGDRATVLTGQWWVVWDTEEVSEMLDWMRAHNQTVPAEKKVRFHGVDVVSNATGRTEVLNYLRGVAPERVPRTDSLFRLLAEEEARRTTPDSLVRAHAASQLQVLADDLVHDRASFVDRSSSSEFVQMLQFLKVMKQSVTPGRAAAMADNLMYVIDHELPGAKFVLWAFDTHIAKSRGLGKRMQDTFGEQYYSVALIFNQGSYQTRHFKPGEPAGDLKASVAPAAPPGTLTWHLSRVNVGNLFLDLRRTTPGDPAVQHWLDTPQVRWLAGWGYGEPTLSPPVTLQEEFDGVIFVEKTTPTRPTPNARNAAANRERL